VGRNEVRTVGSRRGFTLVEVTVALAVGALVVLLAYRVYGGVLDGAARLLAAQQDLGRAANARRLLTALAQGIEVGTVPGSGFQGPRLARTAAGVGVHE